jgi:hypothetical protein
MVVESAGGVGYWQRYGGGMGVGEKKMRKKDEKKYFGIN